MKTPANWLYIPINDGSKRPLFEWGGWPIDSTSEHVYGADDVVSADHEWWAVVGSETEDLLIIDVDFYKMESEQRENVDYGWFGILDDTRVVRTPNGGIHVYLRTDCEFEDLPREIEHVDLKGDVGRGYALTHPTDAYKVVNDVEPVEISLGLLRQLPVFKETSPRESGGREPLITLEELDEVTVAPCIQKALDNGNDYANTLLNAAQFGKIETVDVYKVLDASEYPMDENRAAPRWMHETPSDTGTNFRVDSPGSTYRCWRHGYTGDTFHLIAIYEGWLTCDDIVANDYDRRILKYRARKNGYVNDDDYVTCETVKKHDLCPYDCGKRSPLHGVIK